MRRQTRFSKLLRSPALWFSTLLLFGALAANAATLDGAKAAGQIGESVDGYVHLVDKNAPAAVKALMKDVNNKRREKYASIAKTRGASVESVGLPLSIPCPTSSHDFRNTCADAKNS